MNLGSVDGVEYPYLKSYLDSVPVDNVERHALISYALML